MRNSDADILTIESLLKAKEVLKEHDRVYWECTDGQGHRAATWLEPHFMYGFEFLLVACAGCDRVFHLHIVKDHWEE